LDLFTPQFAAQVHDFNPGIQKSGLFWTAKVPAGSTTIDLAGGTATFRMKNMAILDYQNFVNSVGDQNPPLPLIPSAVSFDVQWKAKPGAQLTSITDATNRFTGTFLDSSATITWSASQSGFTFTSSPASSTTVSGVIGQERNGIFF
jgi:hypothetical protein